MAPPLFGAAFLVWRSDKIENRNNYSMQNRRKYSRRFWESGGFRLFKAVCGKKKRPPRRILHGGLMILPRFIYV